MLKVTHTFEIEGPVKEAVAASREVEQFLKELEVKTEGLYHVQVLLSDTMPRELGAGGGLARKSLGWILVHGWRFTKWTVTGLYHLILKETEPAKEEEAAQ